MKLSPAWQARLETPALVLAAVAMGVGLYFALRERPLSMLSLSGTWLLVLAVGVPLTILTNAARLGLSFHLTGQMRSAVALIRASVVSSTANMLPLPGGVLVRIAYLQTPEVTVRRATGITLGVASIWFALAALGTGAALTLLQGSWVGPLLLLCGAALIVAGWAYLSRQPDGKRVFFLLVLLESAVFFIQALRFTWCFSALGFEASWLQGLALSVACVSGAIVAIVPAGLGVLEMTAALIAPLAKLDPASTFLAVFLDRIATMICLGLVAAVLTWTAAGKVPARE